MKIYKVKVNGKVYEVELEAISEVKGSIKADAPVAAAKPAAAGNGAKLVAPIAGKVVDVLVKVGDTVAQGNNVAIIEAMKLENEVPALAGGVVKAVLVNKGDVVSNGDPIIELE